MFSSGNLLYIRDYKFSNGSEPKTKYFIVLVNNGSDFVIASLPTSKDHIPGFITKIHGCIDSPQHNVNCYYFEPQISICCNGFCFPRETYIYGEQVDSVSLDSVKNNLQNAVEICGTLKPSELQAIKTCFKRGCSTRNKIKKLL